MKNEYSGVEGPADVTEMDKITPLSTTIIKDTICIIPYVGHHLHY